MSRFSFFLYFFVVFFFSFRSAKKRRIFYDLFIFTGGRNVTISLESRTGHVNMKAVAGMMLFIQHWYWFPLAHCLALAFTPTAIIALNSKLKVSRANNLMGWDFSRS